MRFSRFCVFIILTIAATTAAAGAKITGDEVVVNLASNSATGSVSAARNSADSVQFIQCGMWVWGKVTCRARAADGTVGSCVTTDPAYAKMVQMINDSSHIEFYWDNAGNCNNMLVRNGSDYLP